MDTLGPTEAQTAVLARVEGQAPCLFEYNSSDAGSSSESEPEDERQPEFEPGTWVQVHGLVKKPSLNDAIGLVIETVRVRWRVALFTEPDEGSMPREVSLQPQNLRLVWHVDWEAVWTADAAKRWTPGDPASMLLQHATRLALDAFVASGERELIFPRALTTDGRAAVHRVARDEWRGDLDSASIGAATSYNRQVRVCRRDGVAVEVAHSPPDLNDLPFSDLVGLLEKLEEIPDVDAVGAPIKWSVARRKPRAEQFWRWPLSAPRAGRANLFAVFRLLMPHHDLRRYGLSSAKLAEFALEALTGDRDRAKEFGGSWQLAEAEADAANAEAGVAETKPAGDLALQLQAAWEERLAGRRPTLTVRHVNAALDALRAGGKRETLKALLVAATPLEAKWLVRIIGRDLGIGHRPKMPVPHKGEHPKLLMDGFCRAQGRSGRPADGNPPRLYTLLR